MPRYLIERTFSEGLNLSSDYEGVKDCLRIIKNNLDDEVTWVHSYVTEDKQKTFCIYDAPSPEALRRAARRNNLPVNKIWEVKVLDPYFHI